MTYIPDRISLMIEHGETLLHRSPESISDSLRSQNPRTERGKDEEREREMRLYQFQTFSSANPPNC